MKKLSMISAMANNRVIGKDNEMPWHLPADLQYFKKITMDSPIIMGRKTYDSIGRALPGRLNIVVSRDKSLLIEGCSVVNTPEQALKLVADADEVFITGGAHLYEYFLDKVDRLYLTLIDKEVQGDTHFPDYTQFSWKQVSHCSFEADEKNPHAYSFITLDRMRE